MLLFSPSLLAEMLWLWCSSSCSVKAFLNTRCSYCDKWFSTVPNNGRGTQTYPHQIVLWLLLHKLHNKHTGLCCWLFVLPPHKTEGYFLLPVYHVTLMGTDSALEDATGGFLCPFSVQFGHGVSLYLNFLFFFSSAYFILCFLRLSLCTAPVCSFVFLSPVSDSRQGLIHVQCRHLSPPSNLCCQRFSSVWMATLSCVCRLVSWGVDMFPCVQHETECNR